MSLEQELTTVQALALAELQSGNLAKTIELLRKSLELTETIHGSDSLETGQALFSLALSRAREEDGLDEAKSLCFRSLEIRKAKKGDVDVSIALTAEFLAILEIRSGDYFSANQLLRLCLSNALSLVGPVHVNTAKVQFLLGSVLSQLTGKEEEACDLLSKSLGTRLSIFGPESPEAIQSRSALVTILTRINDVERLDKLDKHPIPDNMMSSIPFQQSMR
jgi:tetratricopeptide (TPR) repeat protein